MAPIRVALIGLSAKAIASWAANAHLPYLQSARGKAHYEIVALLNSSVAAAEAARTTFNLPSTVKAYGDPHALAADPDVDLVVDNTRTDVHFPTIEPSVKAGKAVFVEWPLTESLERSTSLTNGGRLNDSLIGLQRRLSPLVLTVKGLLETGRIGKVLSSSVRTFNSYALRDGFNEGFEYMADRRVGGNSITIMYAHMIDYVHSVLGEWADFTSRMQIQRPTKYIVHKDGSRTPLQTGVPDMAWVNGVLAPGRPYVAPGATMAVALRVGPPFKGMPGFTWTIYGETGEILVTSPHGPHFQAPIEIKVQDFATDSVEDIPWDWLEWQKELPWHARDIAEEYERYARWVEAGKPAEVPEDQNWPRLHDAVERHREIDAMFKQFDAQNKA